MRERPDSEADAYVRARRITTLFARPGVFDLSRVAEPVELRGLPEQARRAYDVHSLIHHILDARADSDEDAFEEYRPGGRPTSWSGWAS
jgi:acetyl-CoA/propionyl-CoA carboxylase carboxyl transferase subunit